MRRRVFGCRTDGPRRRRKAGARRALARYRWRLVCDDARRAAPGRSGITGVPLAITKPTRLPAGPASTCRARSNGRLQSKAARSTMPSASFGNGRAAPTRLIQVIGPRRVRSGNTTASSWSTRWCCAARPWRRRRATRGTPIVISFIRRRAGSSADCVWPSSHAERSNEYPNRISRATADRDGAFVRRRCHGRSHRQTQTSAAQIFLRFGRLRPIRPHYPAAGILPDPQRACSSVEARAGHGLAVSARLRSDRIGSGSSRKARILLHAAASVAAYVPVDISGDFLQQDAAQVCRDFPHLAIYPLVADFTAMTEPPVEVASMPRVGFFPDRPSAISSRMRRRPFCAAPHGSWVPARFSWSEWTWSRRPTFSIALITMPRASPRSSI